MAYTDNQNAAGLDALTSLDSGDLLLAGDVSDANRLKKITKANVLTDLGSATQTLTNKTIDADSNTITNIENADIKAGAAIDATKIADGSVTSTEFQYIGTLTSNAQTQLDARLKLDQSTPQTITGGEPIHNTLTASELVATDGSKKLSSLAVATYPSLTELSYVKGVSSAIQTQFSGKVGTTGNETVNGVKTFGSFPVTPSSAPTTNYEVANKKYVDDNAGGAPEGTAVKSTGETGAVKFLREDGDGTCSWQVPSGAGDVVGPGSSTDNAVTRFDSTTGKLLQNSLVTIDDSGSVNIPAGQTYKINGTALAATNVGAIASTEKAAASGVASLDGSSKVVQDPANATATPTASKIVIADGSGKVDGWVTDAAADGSTKGKAAFNANDFNASSGVITLDYANGQKASDTQAGFLTEIATAAETTTGTDATRAVSPDGFAGSNFGIRYISAHLNGTTALTTSEKVYFRIPAGLNGMNLVSVTGTVGTGASGSSSSGTPTFTVKNVTDNQQMLSTSLTIDANEYSSATAATPVVINTSYDDVATDDLLEVAVTTSGTGVTYAVVTLGFQLP
jgi:hypothetical protein